MGKAVIRCLARPLLAFVAACVASLALAHAQLERAVPAAGSAVRESPSRLTLWFSQRLEPAFSEIRVLNPDGNKVDNGDSRVGGADATELSVSLPKLVRGTYRVRWRVLSVDTHVSEGDYTFDVGP
jgi:copper resistance protein C